MEDDKGLELSLGLACGGSSSPSIDKSDNSADAKTETDERTSKILNDFRNFLNAGAPQSFHRADPVTRQDNVYNSLQQTTSGGNDLASKRKHTYVGKEINKKQETESFSSVLQDKGKNSHISITTDEGSTGDNEDVAESEEAEGTSSRTGSHRDDGSRILGGSRSSSQAPKETNEKSDISASSFPIQTMNISSVPYSITIHDSPSTNAPSSSVYPFSMQSIPPTSGGHTRPHAISSGTMTMPITYSSIQIPDKDSPWGMTRPQPLHSPYAGRSTPTSVSMHMTNVSSSELALSDMRPLDQLRGPLGAKRVGEDSSSSQPEGDASAGANSSFPSDYPAIRPGIAAEVKFGGSGSLPNLPWVSTTGTGPNGKTISGVTYKYNATQIKIVCACHGYHLSPEEFIQHATPEQPSAVASTGLASRQSNNLPTSSAMS